MTAMTAMTAMMAIEIDACEGLGAWIRVEATEMGEGAHLHRCKFVYTVKTDEKGKLAKFKARLVFVGSTQRQGVSFNETFSDTLRYASVREILATGHAHGYELFNLDIRNAYLTALLDTVLFMRDIPGRERVGRDGQQMVLKVLRALYGTRQAGRLFRERLHAWLVAWGFRQCTYDKCVYVMQSGADHLVVGVFVDDLACAASSKKLRERFVRDLGTEFNLDDRGNITWLLGMHVHRDFARGTLTYHARRESGRLQSYTGSMQATQELLTRQRTAC